MNPSTPLTTLRVVALGGGAGLPAMMRGIAAAFCPRERSWAPAGDHDLLSGLRCRGHDAVVRHRLGSLILTSANGPEKVSRWTVERVGDPSSRGAIAAADLIVLGPGSLFTNLLPALLIGQTAEEIGRSRARIALLMNLMTEPGETDGYVASDFVRAIRRWAPEVPIHDVLLNDAPMRSDQVVSSARRGALPIGYDTGALEALGCRPLTRDLLWDGPAIRHDPRKVGRAILDLVADLETRTRDRPRLWTAQSARAGPDATTPDDGSGQEFSPTDSVVTR